MNREQRRAARRAGVDSVRRGFGAGALWAIPATFTPSAPGSEGWREWQECGGNDGPSAGPEIGPCTRCGAATRRYGNDADPLCKPCRSAS